MKSTIHSLWAGALVSVLPFCLSSSVYGDEHHHGSSASFTVSPIKGDLTLLQGKGGNIAVLKGEQGLLMVDDDYKDMSPALLAELEKLGGVEQLVYLINTHWHGDHTEGNLVLGEHGTIVAHENVRSRLQERQEVKLFGMVSEPYPEVALPSITYDDEMNIHFNGENIELEHFSEGHTDGDSVVFFKKHNVVHMGDHFFNGFFPFVDVENDGSVSGVAENVTDILEMINDDTIIVPGHGPLAKKADLVAFRDMLLGTSEEVKKMKEAGLTKEQAQEKGLSAEWDEWTDGFLKTSDWVGIVYSSLENDD